MQVVNKRYSDSYIGTFEKTAEDSKRIADIRNMVITMNKDLARHGATQRFYVKLQGRAKNRYEKVKGYYANKHPYISESDLVRFVKSRVRCSIPLEFAERLDLYIYEKT